MRVHETIGANSQSYGVTKNVIELPSFQAAVLVHLFEHIELSEPVDTLKFSLAGGNLHFAGFGKMQSPRFLGLHVVFTLATTSSRIYVALTNGSPAEIARVLSNLEEIDQENGTPLEQYAFLHVDDAYLRKHNRAAVLLFTPDRFPGFHQLAETAIIKAKPVTFSMTVFVSLEEYEFARGYGTQALLERFDESDRDLTSI